MICFFKYVYLDSQEFLRKPVVAIKCNSFARINVSQYK